MLTRAYIQQYDTGQVEPEHKEVLCVLAARGIDCQLLQMRQLLSGSFPVDANTLYVGDHDFIRTVLKKARIPNPPSDSYPQSLHPFLKRAVWESTVAQVKMSCYKADFEPYFIKPKTDVKSFTGYLLRSDNDLFRIDRLPRSMVLHCSERVVWQSEFRVFVNGAEIVGVGHYAGDSEIKINLQVAEAAIAALNGSEAQTAACALDFGVLDNGHTALVEWNDGFALGAYGIDPAVYADLLIARWLELVK